MNTCTVVMYHYVRDVEATPFPAIKALAIADFESQLDVLQSQYTIIDYQTFEALLDGKERAKEPTALLTFDDGFVDHYEVVFPILTRRGLSGVFFLAGSPLADPPHVLNVHKTHFLLARLGVEAFTGEGKRELNRYEHDGRLAHPSRDGVYRYDAMSDRDIKQALNYELPFEVVDAVLGRLFERSLGSLSTFAARLYVTKAMVGEMAQGGMAFGWHTETHRVLSRLDEATQTSELARGRELIASLTGQRTVPFCYPYGHAHTYNDSTLKALEIFGYSMAFTVVRKSVRLDAASRHRYELPRVDCKDLPPFRQAKELSLHA